MILTGSIYIYIYLKYHSVLLDSVSLKSFVIEQHLRTPGMEHLQSLSSVNELRYRWLSLYRYLVAHGFSEARVDDFIGQQEFRENYKPVD
jgi:hypothetical protein